jgi:hypothetical protein
LAISDSYRGSCATAMYPGRARTLTFDRFTLTLTRLNFPSIVAFVG